MLGRRTGWGLGVLVVLGLGIGGSALTRPVPVPVRAPTTTAPSLPAPVRSEVPVPTATPGPAPAAAGPAPAMPASDPVRLRVPAIAVDSGLVALGLRSDGTLEVPSGAFPAGWYTGAPTPGERGPAVIAGHVDLDRVPGVFHDLAALRVGDLVLVDRQDGTSATFAVDLVGRYPKDAFPTAAVYGDSRGAGLRLITCGGQFDAAAGHYEDNVVVFASLVDPSSAR